MRLNHEVVFGVDGRKGLPGRWQADVDRAAASRTQGRSLTDGELGCALSHREIYRRITTQKLPGAIVLEDDAVIGAQFTTFLERRLYLRAPLMMLDHSHARVADAGVELMTGVQMCRLTLPSCLTTAYSISAEAALVLLDAASPIRAPADWPGDIVALGAVALHPRIVSHPNPTSGKSHLHAERDAMPQNHGSFRRALYRWTSTAHWQRWLTKRRSTRIS
jgi:glycosyl transferase family 25